MMYSTSSTRSISQGSPPSTWPLHGSRYSQVNRSRQSKRGRLMARMGGAFSFNRRHALRAVSIALALLVALTATAPAAAQTGSPSEDRASLVALYDATDGPNWTNNANWLSGNALDTWYGVPTDASGRVTALSLGENQLNGQVPPELDSLSSVTVLDLTRNQLSGELPPEVGNLANLQRLYLHDNQLSGQIPRSWATPPT